MFEERFERDSTAAYESFVHLKYPIKMSNGLRSDGKIMAISQYEVVTEVQRKTRW